MDLFDAIGTCIQRFSLYYKEDEAASMPKWFDLHAWSNLLNQFQQMHHSHVWLDQENSTEGKLLPMWTTLVSVRDFFNRGVFLHAPRRMLTMFTLFPHKDAVGRNQLLHMPLTSLSPEEEEEEETEDVMVTQGYPCRQWVLTQLLASHPETPLPPVPLLSSNHLHLPLSPRAFDRLHHALLCPLSHACFYLYLADMNQLFCFFRLCLSCDATFLKGMQTNLLKIVDIAHPLLTGFFLEAIMSIDDVVMLQKTLALKPLLKETHQALHWQRYLETAALYEAKACHHFLLKTQATVH